MISKQFRKTISGLLAAVSIFVTPAFAQVAPPAGADNPLAQILFQAEDMRIRLQNLQILSQYCKAPYEPNKAEHKAAIERESKLLKTLIGEFRSVHNRYKAGESFVDPFPVIDTFRPNDPPPGDQKYWASAQGLLTQVQNLLATKSRKLTDAKERDCAPAETPQKPSQDPAPPSDPLADLKRPVPRHIDIPQLPHYFCSREERTAFWRSFESEWLEAADNVVDASSYRAEVSRRGAEHFIKDGDPAQQKRLDAEERWADKNFTQHLRMRDRVDAIRDMILNTPIIDCSLISKNTTPDPISLGVRAEGLKDEIQAIDSRIKEIDRKLAEVKAEVDREIPAELDEAYQRGLLDQEGYFGFDLAQWLKEVYKYKQSLQREQRDLEWQKKVLEDELKRTTQFSEDTQKTSAKIEAAPKTAEEPREKLQEKRPSLLESLMPVLIPSISIGIGGGGKPRHHERERR